MAADFHEQLTKYLADAHAIEQRLNAPGGDPSGLKDGAMRLGALDWAGFFQAHPDTTGKLDAFEHLEIGGYEQLKRVAERAGDGETGELVDRILGEERRAAERIASTFDEAITVSLAA